MFFQNITVISVLSLAFFLCQCGSGQKQSAKDDKKTASVPLTVKVKNDKSYLKDKAGIWFDAAPSSVNKNLEKLQTLGYLGGYKPAPVKKGVSIYVENAVQEGVNLIVSGHKPYAAMIDMKGVTMHSWSFKYDNLGIDKDELIVNPKVDENFKNYWRRVKLFDDGSILAIYDYQALIKIDKNSNLLWAYPARAHHDLFTTAAGDIWLLTTEKRILPEIHKTKPIFDDHIVILDQNGKEKRKISLVDCFKNSKYSFYLNKVKRENPDAVALDIFHTNAIKILDGRVANDNKAFQKGNVLVSVRELNLLAVIDPEKATVLWVTEGPWKAQHEPIVLRNGNILLFDNRGGGTFSRVLEFHPNFPTNILWSYSALPPESFYSPIVGSQQRLSNGNTLITDTAGGRAFEVDSGNKIVWEYYNPERAGKGRHLIAAIFEIIRLPFSSVDFLSTD